MIDKHKEIRDTAMDTLLEEKLMENLKWSMLFFVFNHVCLMLSQDEDGEIQEKPGALQKEFFKSWKNFANQKLIAPDMEMINSKLNSDVNLFSSVLRGENELTESTEVYQEKYYAVLQKIESLFNSTINEFTEDLEGGDDTYA
jgi:hypothetical protein